MDRKPTVLSILHVLASGEVGGLESVVRALAVGLSQRGHDVSVIAILDLEPVPHPFELSLAREACNRDPLAPARHLLREGVFRAFLRAAPRVVHAHGYRRMCRGKRSAPARIAAISTVRRFTGTGRIGCTSASRSAPCADATPWSR
jgi:hypothetical protein